MNKKLYLFFLPFVCNLAYSDIILDAKGFDTNQHKNEKEIAFSEKGKEQAKAHNYFIKALNAREQNKPNEFLENLLLAMKQNQNDNSLLLLLTSSISNIPFRNQFNIPLQKHLKITVPFAKDNPQMVKLNLFAAYLLTTKEKNDKALELLETSAEFLSKDSSIYSDFVEDIMRLYIIQSQIQKGEEFIKNVFSEDSAHKNIKLLTTAMTFYNFAKENSKNEQWLWFLEGVKEKYERILEQNLNNIDKVASCAFIPQNEFIKVLEFYKNKKSYTKCKELLLQNLSFKPNDRKNLIYLAKTLYNLKEYNHSYRIWDSFIKNNIANKKQTRHLKALSIPFYHSYLKSAVASGRMKEAKKIAEKYMKVTSSPFSVYDVISIYLQKNKFEIALNILNSIEKKSTIKYYYYGIINRALKKYKEALTGFDNAEKLAIKNDNEKFLNIDFYFDFAVTAEKGKDMVQTQRCLEIILSKDVDNHIAANFLGYLLACQNKDLPRAKELILKALEKEPENVAYLDSLAWVYYQQKNYTKALEYMEKIISIDEEIKESEIADHLGDIYLKLEDIDAAIKYWELAIELDGEHIDKQKIKFKIQENSN